MIKVFDIFAGYGGAEFALKKAGIEHECIGFSEIDKYAIQCFKQNHGDIKNYGDCTKINTDELPDFDLLCGGFPCQSFSVAGKGLGELDPRGTLFYEIVRIAEIKQPKYMLLENVKGLTFKTHKATFDKILSELDRIGYNVRWKVLNTRDFGIPQNRERVFFVCIRKDLDQEFEFPQPTEKRLTLKDILLDEVEQKYYLTDSQLNTLQRKFESKGKCLDGRNESDTIITSMGTGGGNVPYITNTSPREIGFREESPALCARDYKDPKIIRGRPKLPYENGKRELEFKEYTEYCPALSTNPASGDQKNIVMTDKTRDIEKALSLAKEMSNNGKPTQIDLYHLQHGEIRPLTTYIPQDQDNHRCLQAGEPKELLYDTKQFRKLTPKECFRLMGFVFDEINLDGISDSQQYKLAGNGWCIQTVSKIFTEMFKNTEYMNR